MSPSRRTLALGAAAALLAVAGVLVALRGDRTPASSASTTTDTTAESSGTTVPEAPPHYSLAATRRCLLAEDFAVSNIRSDDPRLRALGDLAQRTSLELRRDGATIGLAFGDTRLLVSLLSVPDDPYRLEPQRNALLMYRPGTAELAAIVRSCLRA